MAKLKIKSEIIAPHGGIFQIMDVFERLGLGKLMAIKKTSRLKKVLLHFICVPAKWIRSGRRYILKMYTERQYYNDVFCY